MTHEHERGWTLHYCRNTECNATHKMYLDKLNDAWKCAVCGTVHTPSKNSAPDARKPDCNRGE